MTQPNGLNEFSSEIKDKSQSSTKRNEQCMTSGSDPTTPRYSSSSLWNIQDTAILDALDDSDDESVPATEFPEKPREKQTNTTQESEGSTVNEERQVASKLHVTSSNKEVVAPRIQQPTSLFDASNLESLDMDEFSDDD